MLDTKINLFGIEFKNPVMNASGTGGYGKELDSFYPLDTLGGFVSKSCTFNPRFGNPLPRIADASLGCLNCIGLTNPGVKKLAQEEIPPIVNKYPNLPYLCSIAGETKEEYIKEIEILNKVDGIDIYEINISCPNVENGGMALASNPNLAYQITKECKKASKHPIFMKLTPNGVDIAKIAIECEKAGADGLILANSYQGMRIDLRTGKPILSRKIGGYGGPGIFPMALKVIYQCAKVTSIPIIGVGGVSSAEDVIEMLYAGASLVEVGSLNLKDPYACKKIVDELENVMKEYNITSLKDIIKGALKYE